MKHTFQILSGTISTAKEFLLHQPQITEVIQKNDTLEVTMDTHVDIVSLLKQKHILVTEVTSHGETKSSSFATYLPLFVVFAYILGMTAIVVQPNFSQDKVMVLMGFWFVFFSLFKMIDIVGFAQGYATYDIVARRWFGWGLLFPFIEVFFAIAHFIPIIDHKILAWLVIGVFSVASIGVIQKILKKEQIVCSCLGTVLKAPLTTVTLAENSIMILLAVTMLL